MGFRENKGKAKQIYVDIYIYIAHRNACKDSSDETQKRPQEQQQAKTTHKNQKQTIAAISVLRSESCLSSLTVLPLDFVFMAAELELMNRLCLGDMAVPLVSKSMDFWDIQKLLEASDEEDAPFHLLNFKATGEHLWLERAFKLPSRWWIKHQSRLPLFQEIRQSIEAMKKGGKKEKNMSDLMAKRTNVIVAIQLRGQVILVVNDARSATVAFRHGEESELLLWFLREIEKDIRSLQSGGLKSLKRKEKVEDINEQEETIVNEVVENLKQHPKCRSACFAKSRGCLIVNTKEFFVAKWNKIRQKAILTDEWENLKKEFLLASESASEFLDNLVAKTQASASKPSVSPERKAPDEEEDDDDDNDDEEEENIKVT